MLSLPSRLPSLWLEKLQTAMVVILDADMIIHGPIAPWELTAEKGKPIAAYIGNITTTIFLFHQTSIVLQSHSVF
ncbi:hypothetical protein FF1_042898 [Malus domestica]